MVVGSTIVHRHTSTEFDAQTPFSLALVETVEDARFMARFAAADTLQPGDHVTLTFTGTPPLPTAVPRDR
jgi:uncharacterized OB-fold protein